MGVPKRVDRKHNWAEKDWAENKSGPKSDQPEYIINRNRDYVIEFLFINLIMKYPSLKTYVYAKHAF